MMAATGEHVLILVKDARGYQTVCSCGCYQSRWYTYPSTATVAGNKHKWMKEHE
jgi:hypothetical protein